MSTEPALRQGVWQAYSEVARRPTAESRFRVGRRFAEELGYAPTWLERLPPVSVEAFTGVSNVSVFAEVAAGSTVLDLGCGAGLDTLIAAERVGPGGQVLGLDFSQAMLARARQGAGQAGLRQAHFGLAAAEALPLPDNSVDTVLVNGIFNLNLQRTRIFAELGRIVRRGGTVYAAELILREPAGAPAPERWDDWFS
jgi:SAM-dependent methyltransferase